MAFTNAQLVRREAGDAGTVIRDVANGDGVGTIFYASAKPLAADTAVVRVGGVLKTEGADYSLNDETGEIVFTSAPASGTENITIVYSSVRITDAGVAEALRQFGLVAGDTSTPGTAAALEAAAMLCDWIAAETAQDFDFEADGTSAKRSSVSEAFRAQAAAIRDKLRRGRGLVSTPVTRVDGYSALGEFDGRDYLGIREGRRLYYGGSVDDLP